MATRYRCAHCQRPCGVMGHVRPATTRRPRCPNTRAFPIHAVAGLGMEVPEVGFCCPAGHTCWVQKREDRRDVDRSVLRVPERWRMDQPTTAQLAYLRSLGYPGDHPRSKGEAHDLIEIWLKRPVPAQMGDRAILIRGGEPRQKEP